MQGLSELGKENYPRTLPYLNKKYCVEVCNCSHQGNKEKKSPATFDLDNDGRAKERTMGGSNEISQRILEDKKERKLLKSKFQDYKVTCLPPKIWEV